MSIDLVGMSAPEIRDHVSLPELLIAIQGVVKWDVELANKLDVAYRSRVLRLLGRPRCSIEELGELSDHLRRVAGLSRRSLFVNAIGDPLGEYWQAYARLLEGRAAGLATRDPVAVSKLSEVANILAFLSDQGEVEESTLAGRVGLNARKLAYTLNLMEGNNLVERWRVKGQSFICLGRATGVTRV